MMNKLVVSSVVAIVLLATGAFVVLNSSDEKDTRESTVATQQTAPASQQQQPSTQPAETSQTQSAGVYVDYSDKALADASGTSRVVFFHAEWCSTCKFFENDIKSAGIPEGITILEADYDGETDLKSQYGVSVQSTFVLLDGDGNVVRTWPFASGLRSAQDLYDAVSAEA